MLAIILFLSTAGTHAVETGRIKACTDVPVDHRSVPVGFRCRTSKGAVFRRVTRDGEGAWKGPDGLIWENTYWGKLNHQAATEICSSGGARVPSRADFERAESYGFREALRDMVDNPFPSDPDYWYPFYWTSTIRREFPNSEQAYFFNGPDGKIDADFRANGYATRCVAR